MSTTDRPAYFPATRDLYETFVDEITAIGGVVPDVHDDGERLFARAVLPVRTDVRPGDHVRGGVAVRATGSELLVHPYTFRQVCSNGAIAAHALETRRLERIPGSDVVAPDYEISVALTDFRLAVQACASKDAFERTADEMRSAATIRADMTINLMSAVVQAGGFAVQQFVPMIFQSFETEPDRSVFGFMNAVTSVARTVRDPEARWRLEELGGGIPARLVPTPKSTVGAAVMSAS
jgi:hypothetical protein